LKLNINQSIIYIVATSQMEYMYNVLIYRIYMFVCFCFCFIFIFI